MSDTSRRFDGPLIAHVAGVQRGRRLEQQHMCFADGDRLVLDATGNDNELAGVEADDAVPQMDIEVPVNDEEHSNE